MRKLIVFLITVVVILSARPSFGWIDTGHKIVAFIAWEELTPKTRGAVLDLLKQHPRYDKDLLARAPLDATPQQLDEHVFATAATWPDMVRLQGNPMHAAYNHPSWHYINIPFVVGGQTAPSDAASDVSGPHDILQALAKNLADLKDSSVAPSDKAIAVCWILHLVGDIHQPLHATEMYSPAFPQGDQGGNAEVVLRDPPYPDSRIKLHLLWDELPGEFKSEDLEGYEAAGIRNDPRYSREGLKDAIAVTDFAAWAKESYDLGVKYAYLEGALKTALAKEDRSAARTPIPGVPPGYIERAEHVATRQVALAGHRLADLLNKTFDPK